MLCLCMLICLTVPVSRASTPLSNGNVLQDFCNSSKVLGGSLGSLSGLVRSPSGRGPAKPIRFREKRLQVKGILLL